MPEPDPVEPAPAAALSEQERSHAFRAALSPERASALSQGRVPVPPTFIRWIIAGFLVLGVGGALAEHYVGAGATVSSTTLPTATTIPLRPGGPSLNSSSTALLGWKPIATATAPDISLRDQRGATWTLSAQRQRVVLVTFMNERCNDVCPVLAQELKVALHQLGPTASIEVAIVNTDPHHTEPSKLPAALSSTGLATLSDVHFLSGSLATLNSVWTSYGVSVFVDASGRVAHNNVLYVIGPHRRMIALAVPFGNESRSGVFTLSHALESHFGTDLAAATASLATP